MIFDKFKKIKLKWTLFIVLLLMLNILIISIFTLKSIYNHQKYVTQDLLLENSKLINLYIREQYVSSDKSIWHNLDHGNYISASDKYFDFENFYKSESYSLLLNLKKIIPLHIIFYDLDANMLNYDYDYKLKDYETKLLKKALNDNILYQKQNNQISYFAPIYDFDRQIGVVQLNYYTNEDTMFYNQIKFFLLKMGLFSLIITGSFGILYFSRVSSQINKLTLNIKHIQNGNYNIINILKTKDELAELSQGIYFASNEIKLQINYLNEEKKKLQLALNKLKKLESKQKHFINNITHEFKTPLAIIQTQIDLITLYHDDLNMVKTAKEIAQKEIKRLDFMVLNAIELSKLEKYEFEKNIQSLNIKKILKDLCKSMSFKANKYNIQIITDLNDAYINCDLEEILKIFINLIDNAIKYNKVGGKIYIRNYDKNNKLIIEVQDTGIGISNEDKLKVFDPFYVVDKNRSKKFSGTGLGLSLVKKIIDNNNWDIEILDTKNGTILKITI